MQAYYELLQAKKIDAGGGRGTCEEDLCAGGAPVSGGPSLPAPSPGYCLTPTPPSDGRATNQIMVHQ